jgi:hypothetical protein
MPVAFNIFADLIFCFTTLTLATQLLRDGWPDDYMCFPRSPYRPGPEPEPEPEPVPDKGCLRLINITRVQISVDVAISFIIG